MDVLTDLPLFIDVKPGSLIADRYEVLQQIAAGGMGIVFKVSDRSLNGEVVALKLLNPHLSQDELVFKRFLNEVLVARSLSHPNIVRTHDIGKTREGASYITMEFVDGDTLANQLDDNFEAFQKGDRETPGLFVKESIRVLLHVLRGMAYAHEQGIIHRDLKPANILITKKNEIKIADFGTARIVGANTGLTQDGSIMGTPDYMSPEQIAGDELDPCCDIYALGIIAYELVVGEKPFPGENLVQVAFQHVNEPIPSFDPAGFEVPRWYQDIVRKAAAKQRKDRFQSAEEFAAAILDACPELATASGAWPAMSSARLPTYSESQEAPVRARSSELTLSEKGLGDFRESSNEEFQSSHEHAVLESSEPSRRIIHAGVGFFLTIAVVVSVGVAYVFLSDRLMRVPASEMSQEVSRKQLENEIFGNSESTHTESTIEVAKTVDPDTTSSVVPEVTPEPVKPQKTASVETMSKDIPKDAQAVQTAVVEDETSTRPQVNQPAMTSKVQKNPVPEFTPPPQQFARQEANIGQRVGGAIGDKGVGERDLLAVSYERYQGTFATHGGSSKTLSMQLALGDSSIAGTATIEGYGEFSASGELHSRGLKITLVNSSTRITLTGSKRQDVLRGTYFIAAENERGNWQVSLR